MRALRYILIWLVVVILFYIYGWSSGGGPYSEEAVGNAAIGVGVATHVVAGLILIHGIRARGLNRGLAAMFLIASLIVSPILPMIVVSVIMRATQYGGVGDATGIHLFQGESALWLGVAPVLAFWIMLCASIVFLICIFKVARSNKALHATTVVPGN